MARKRSNRTSPGKRNGRPVISETKEPTKTALITVTIKRHRDTHGNHPHVILGDIDQNHVSVGLSTKLTKGANSKNKNYTLENDPVGNLPAGEKSYMRRQGTVAPKREYNDPRRGKMTPKDFARAQEYGEKAKQKYLNRKNKKK